jgi:pimeloyl-ACP methyl ester carboxylesterase
MNPSLLTGIFAGMAIPGCGVYLRYRRDMSAARARLATMERHVLSTPWGAVEYAERGDGEPVLVVHGIFQHCVAGLFSVRDLLLDRRVIAPSRFGCLGSSMPPNATPSAQADAFAALLDALHIRQIDVVAFSAGATSALQLALRHPEEDISVPTLIAHTKDDQLASHAASKRAAERIPGARFVSLESGGHLMLGQQKKGRDELADFFAERSHRRAERVAS